jgi:hypothetical protein
MSSRSSKNHILTYASKCISPFYFLLKFYQHCVLQILRHLLKFIGNPWFIIHGVFEGLGFRVVSNEVLLNLFLEAWN